MSRRARDLDTLNQDILQRETRASRSGLSVLVGVVVIALLGYLALETGTRAVGHEPWLIAPERAWAWFVGLPGSSNPPVGVAVAGALILAIGVGLLAAALTRGTRRRHSLPTHRVVALVDDDVIGQSLVRAAHLAAGVGPDQVRVVVDRAAVLVTVRPTSGVSIEGAAVEEGVRSELERQGFAGVFTVSVTVTATGVVGQ